MHSAIMGEPADATAKLTRDACYDCRCLTGCKLTDKLWLADKLRGNPGVVWCFMRALTLYGLVYVNPKARDRAVVCAGFPHAVNDARQGFGLKGVLPGGGVDKNVLSPSC